MKIRSRDAARINDGKLFAAALFGAGGALALAGLAARKLTKPAAIETQFLSPWELDIPYEDISFVTSDGLRISGWWLPNREASRTIVVLGGYNSARQHVLGVSSGLWRGGANVLLFDNRARGTSEGDYVSLGDHERLDAKAAIGYALGREANLPLGVIGFSMGGAVALMVAAADDRIAALVVDSPFASQTALLRSRLEGYVGPLAGPALALAKLFLDHDPGEVEPLENIVGITCPVMFIHGAEDDITDPEDSEKMYSLAREPKELWVIPGADHVGSYYADRIAYTQKVNAFCDKHL